METVEEIKDLLIDNSSVTEWDDRSTLEFVLHYYDWNENELDDNAMLEANIFANDMEYLMWYFEDDTTQFLIKQIVDCESVNELMYSCMHEATRKLHNGAIVRYLI